MSAHCLECGTAGLGSCEHVGSEKEVFRLQAEVERLKKELEWFPALKAAKRTADFQLESANLQINEVKSILRGALGSTDPSIIDGNLSYSTVMGGQAYMDLLAFSQGRKIAPRIDEIWITEKDAPVDEKLWLVKASGGVLEIRAYNDAKAAHSTVTLKRVGHAIREYLPYGNDFGPSDRTDHPGFK